MSATSDSAVRTSLVKGIDLAGFMTGDPARSIAFYRDVLGMVPTVLDDEGRGAEFTLSDGSTFGVWQPGDGSSSAIFMFAVDAIDDAVAEFRKRGATLGDVSETQMCFMAYGSDPDGNAFIIHQRKMASADV
jgi:predicted enzyme related to lactoylglutathione lyase